MTKNLISFVIKNKFLFLLIPFLFVLPIIGFTQDSGTKITGKVLDENGKPLEAVSVNIKNETAGVVTNGNGEFSLQVPSLNEILVFTYIGYVKQEIFIKKRTHIEVRLAPDRTSLNEVVVIGYGTQKKVNLTGAVSTISSKSLTDRPIGQTSAALQGLMPGVTVKQNSGQPGADQGSVLIRGIGTLGDAGPLVLIDGVEGNINNIDPNLIESISVLKDAASASIYGSRAANGVILITTKRAHNSKLSINYDGYTGWQKATNVPNSVNAIDHMLLTNEAYVNVGRSPLYSDDLISKYRTNALTDPDQYPNTDWQKEVLTGSGLMQSHFLSVSGGSDKIRLLSSIGYFDQKGIIQNSDFKRYTFRNNADFKLSNKLSIRLDFQVDNQMTKEPGRGADFVFYEMNRIPTNLPFRFSNGDWGQGWNGNNPVAYSSDDGGIHKNNRPEILLNTSINYKPFNWMEANITYSPRYTESIDHEFIRAIQTYNFDGSPAFVAPAKTTLTEDNVHSFYNDFYGTLTLNKNIKEHGLKLLLGTSSDDFYTSNVSAYRDVFNLPEYPVLNTGSAENQQNSGTASEWALQSFFGRFNYNYKHKYLLEVNGRYDGSSRFAKGHKYGFFPSVSAGWRISEEPFMQSLKKTVNELKLRGSWGKLGNQNIGTYPFTSSIAIGSYTMNKAIVDIAALNTMANADITWETTEMTDIGLDLKLFSSLTFTGDYYFKQTRNILLQLNIPLTVGLNAPYQNAGVVNNKGWEIGLNYEGNIRDFNYGIALNLSDVKNKVIDLHGIKQTGVTVNREGYSMNSIYGLQAEGLFQTDEETSKHATQFGDVKPGDIRYRDQNGDGIINSDDNVILGNTIPRYTFGVTLNTSYKNFDFTLFLQGVGKANGLLYGEEIMPFYNGGTIQEPVKDHHWTPDNRNALFPRLAFGNNNNEQISSFWLKNASYLRLKNLQLGYSFRNRRIEKVGINNIRIYVSGRNIFTLDKFWKGHDVETPVGLARDYPLVKVWSVGLNLNF